MTDDLSKKQDLISSIRDKMGNEISFRSGTNPDEELYLRKFNNLGNIVYQGTYKQNMKDGLHISFNNDGTFKSQAYFKEDKEINMPPDIKLYTAVKYGDLSKVKDVLTYYPTLVDLTTPAELQFFPATTDKEPYSILELSIKNNRTEIAHFILDSGAKTDDYSIRALNENKTKKHDPVSLAITTFNNSVLQKILFKNPEILQQHHRELLKTIKDKISLNTTQLTNSLNFINTKQEHNKKFKM